MERSKVFPWNSLGIIAALSAALCFLIAYVLALGEGKPDASIIAFMAYAMDRNNVVYWMIMFSTVSIVFSGYALYKKEHGIAKLVPEFERIFRAHPNTITEDGVDAVLKKLAQGVLTAREKADRAELVISTLDELEVGEHFLGTPEYEDAHDLAEFRRRELAHAENVFFSAASSANAFGLLYGMSSTLLLGWPSEQAEKVLAVYAKFSPIRQEEFDVPAEFIHGAGRKRKN